MSMACVEWQENRQKHIDALKAKYPRGITWQQISDEACDREDRGFAEAASFQSVQDDVEAGGIRVLGRPPHE